MTNLPATPQFTAPTSVSQGVSWYARARDFLTQVWNWLTTWSFAAKVAWAVFFVLLGLVILAWTVLWNSNNVPWTDTFSVEKLETVVLMFVIPLVVYRLVSAWTTGVESYQPDIKSAWERGVATLKTAGIPIDATPVYLVIGSSGQRLERRLMEGLDRTFVVKPEANDNHPLHWYATRNAIYLFCTDCSWTNELARRIEAAPVPSETLPDAPASLRGIPAYSGMNSAHRGGASRPQRGAGTMELADHGQAESFDFSRSASGDRPDLGGGETVNAGIVIEDFVSVTLSADESARQLQRLTYCCQMLKAIRDPLCPINGILLLTPFQVLERQRIEIEHYHRAVRGDLQTIQQTLMLKAPVVVLFFGLEKVRGFQELVRRIGKRGAATRRFGRGFELRALATVHEMQQYTSHLAGVFEDWIYKLFCEQDALARPGNHLLYELLSTIRTRLKTHLSSLLSLGIGHAPNEAQSDEQLRFGGCYFASTGQEPDEQAFFSAVFSKLESLQEEIEWTDTAIRRQAQYSFSLMLAFSLIVVSGLALAAMIFWTQMTS